jgi:hypothetical protein
MTPTGTRKEINAVERSVSVTALIDFWKSKADYLETSVQFCVMYISNPI